MTTTTATRPAVGPAQLVGVRRDKLNAPVYRVTPLEGGYELVEYLVNAAAPFVYGGPNGRQPIDLAELGIAEGFADVEWLDRFSLPTRGEHVARITAHRDPATAELAARFATQASTTPAEGDRYVVSFLEGYQLVQNRDLDHRSCSCGQGVTTYAEGTVTGFTHWADNSVDVHIKLDDGRAVTRQLVAPHGDACY